LTRGKRPLTCDDVNRGDISQCHALPSDAVECRILSPMRPHNDCLRWASIRAIRTSFLAADRVVVDAAQDFHRVPGPRRDGRLVHALVEPPGCLRS
jgi:hypothetical protein